MLSRFRLFWNKSEYNTKCNVMYANFKTPIRKKLSHLTKRKVNQVVCCDNSDDEEGLTLDDDDLGFLKKTESLLKKMEK